MKGAIALMPKLPAYERCIYCTYGYHLLCSSLANKRFPFHTQRNFC